MLPVTPYPLRGPGYWGSPFARPRPIRVGHRIPKGVWMIQCGPNRVEIVWRENDDFDDEPRRAPGTGMIRPSRRDVPNPQFQQKPPKPPPCPPPGGGSNSLRRAQLVRENSTGVVFADGHSVVLSGVGEATAIRIFSA